MRIVVTGADGFIARNLRVRLRELGAGDVTCVTRATSPQQLREALASADFVFHLAGVNRPKDDAEFIEGNVGSTAALCAGLIATGRKVPVVLASSSQAARDNAYGRSKKAAEDELLRYSQASGAPVYLFRLNNVFGKWCRPFYNSAVATFCHLIARGEPITINDPNAPLSLVYVDDVVESFVGILRGQAPAAGFVQAGPVYETSVGEVARILQGFAANRSSLMTDRVGSGLVRALYATYISYLPLDKFDYKVPAHSDSRGTFVEMLKTPDSGQFSYFTALPGITRGEHYHHSKVEKFLVVKGVARFDFRNIDTGERHTVIARGDEPRIVESIPGWAHGVTNIAADELIIMLWANEVFDRAKPDTVASKATP